MTDKRVLTEDEHLTLVTEVLNNLPKDTTPTEEAAILIAATSFAFSRCDIDDFTPAEMKRFMVPMHITAEKIKDNFQQITDLVKS
jgi:hypothetical protein